VGRTGNPGAAPNTKETLMEPAHLERGVLADGPAPVVEPAPPARSRRPFAVRRLTPFGYLSPTLILILGLMVIPIVMVINYSFRNNVIVEQNPVFIGLANYAAVLTDVNFLVAIKNTFLFISLSTVAHLVLGLTFAMLLNTSLLGGVTKAIFRVIYILPWLFTIAVVAVIWRLMLDPFGVINYILTSIGVLQQGVEWLADPSTALWALTFINIWSGYPFFMISLLAGLQGISADLYEAASVDGASAVQKFFNVTIPQLRPVLISMAVLDLIWTSQQFALIWMTTGGGPLNITEMLSTYTYKQAFSSYEFATASASAVIILLLTMILALFYVRQQRER
jgi:multiple sugar transport system permease protein